MKIDDAIEDRVRTAFSAVLDHDPGALKTALGRLDSDDLATAVSYAIHVCGYVVVDVFNGALSDAGVAELAQYVVNDSREWVELGDAAAVAAFLRAAAAGDPRFPGVPAEDVAGHAFVIGGYLLSRFRHEGQRWFEYLDDIWNSTQAGES
jgi:hypothetical protein